MPVRGVQRALGVERALPERLHHPGVVLGEGGEQPGAQPIGAAVADVGAVDDAPLEPEPDQRGAEAVVRRVHQRVTADRRVGATHRVHQAVPARVSAEHLVEPARRRPDRLVEGLGRQA